MLTSAASQVIRDEHRRLLHRAAPIEPPTANGSEAVFPPRARRYHRSAVVRQKPWALMSKGSTVTFPPSTPYATSSWSWVGVLNRPAVILTKCRHESLPSGRFAEKVLAVVSAKLWGSTDITLKGQAAVSRRDNGSEIVGRAGHEHARLA